MSATVIQNLVGRLSAASSEKHLVEPALGRASPIMLFDEGKEFQQGRLRT